MGGMEAMKQMKVVLGLAPLALCAVTAIGNACHLQERQTQSGVRADYTHIVSTGPDAYGSNTWWSDQDAAYITYRLHDRHWRLAHYTGSGFLRPCLGSDFRTLCIHNFYAYNSPCYILLSL